MNSLDKTNRIAIESFVPGKGERKVLPSNKASNRSAFLGFDSDSPLISNEILIDYLAEILITIFLKQNDKPNKTSSNILSGIDERASR